MDMPDFIGLVAHLKGCQMVKKFACTSPFFASENSMESGPWILENFSAGLMVGIQVGMLCALGPPISFCLLPPVGKRLNLEKVMLRCVFLKSAFSTK